MNEREKYEASLRGLVTAVHDLVIAFEAASLASRAWDPANEKSEMDPAQHAAIASCRAMMIAILARHAGAAQMLGIEGGVR